jgi:hypothetical protein
MFERSRFSDRLGVGNERLKQTDMNIGSRKSKAKKARVAMLVS